MGAVVGPRLGVWIGEDGRRAWKGMAGRKIARAEAKEAWEKLTWEQQRRARQTIADVTGRPFTEDPEELKSA